MTARPHRRPDHRRRSLRHRRGMPSAEKMSWKGLCHPRGPRLHRRNVGPVSLSRACAPIPTCSRSAIRSGLGRKPRPSRMVNPSSTTSARPRASTASTARSASTTASSARRGRRKEERWTVEAERGPAGEAAYFTCNFLLVCSGYYSYAEGYIPDFPRHRPLQRSNRPPSELDRRRRLRQQARGRDRQRRNRRHARAGAREIGDPRHDASALADLYRRVARRRSHRQRLCAAGCQRGRPAPSHGGKTCSPTCTSIGLCKRKPERAKAMIRDGVRDGARAGLRHRHAFHPALQSLGSAALPCAQRRFLQVDQGAARSRS